MHELHMTHIRPTYACVRVHTQETAVVKKKMVAAHDVLEDARLVKRTEDEKRQVMCV